MKGLFVDDIFIHELQLPMTVHASTLPDNNGDYTIIINSLLSAETKRETLQHELVHIKKGHFYDDCLDIAEDEKEANDPVNRAKANSFIKEIR